VRPHLVTSILLAVLLGSCGGATATFDPNAPCTADAKLPGAYPGLEALVPKAFEGRPPSHLDSGRNCTPASLGTLAAAGFREIRFAGGLWEVGNRSGVTLAVMQAPGLTADRVADFYEAGARTARNTENVKRFPGTLNGKAGWQIETLNGESFQTIVVLPAPQASTVRVALVGSDVRETNGIGDHHQRINDALAAFGP
jgi:hypothetical protein